MGLVAATSDACVLLLDGHFEGELALDILARFLARTLLRLQPTNTVQGTSPELGKLLRSDIDHTKEFVTSEQVAALALFLCGDDAAQITGANLSIDGGWTAA